jgi:hypothetical protein
MDFHFEIRVFDDFANSLSESQFDVGGGAAIGDAEGPVDAGKFRNTVSRLCSKCCQ